LPTNVAESSVSACPIRGWSESPNWTQTRRPTAAMNETSPETKERYVARYGSSNSRTSSVTASELIGSNPPAMSRVAVMEATKTHTSSKSTVSIADMV
jgi:hypothetical protein